MNTKELVIVRQMPEIEEHLREFKANVDLRVNEAMQMVCTEETLSAVKTVRAELGKTFKGLEEQRKEVKKLILAPYDAFERVYAECVSDSFKRADADLKRRIDEVEDGLKTQKAERIRAYYTEYCEALGVDFVPFERVVPNIIRSVSDKKYKEQCAAFIDRVIEDLAMIAEHEYAAEIRAEYKKTLNAAQSVTTVADRHRAIEAEKALAEEQSMAAEARRQAAEKVEEVLAMPEPVVEPMPEDDAPFTPPVAEPQEQEPLYNLRFSVTETKEKCTALKKFLVDGGYHFESL